MLIRLFTIIFWVFTFTSPAAAYHQEEPHSVPETETEGNEISQPEGLFNSTTNGLVGRLTRAQQECGAVDIIYRFDCFRQHYLLAASRLEDNPDYAIPVQALHDIEQALEAIVTKNADPTVEPLRRRGKSYQAITPAATAKATAAFNQALDDASTMLLRSPNNNAGHFGRIAQAIDSNKILLRSALLVLCPPGFSAICRPVSGSSRDVGLSQVL